MTLGRLEPAEVGQSVMHDAPEKQMQAVMSQLDALVDAVKAISAKLDAQGGGIDTDYAATITDALTKINLIL